MNVLIADSGSTKTDWVFISSAHKKYFDSSGLNPYLMSLETIEIQLKKAITSFIKNEKPDRVYFYGAGFSTIEHCRKMRKILCKITMTLIVEVHHDILGAARSVCRNESGIVCILGTGSNSCLFDGEKISMQKGGFGYLLGDEGSGSFMGRKLLSEMLNDNLPTSIISKFEKFSGMKLDMIRKQTYNTSTPSSYLGSFTPFIKKNLKVKFIRKIAVESLEEFLENTVLRYPGYKKLPVHFVGSVGYYFKKVLADVCKKHKLKMGRIIKKPIDGLVRFHSES